MTYLQMNWQGRDSSPGQLREAIRLPTRRRVRAMLVVKREALPASEGVNVQSLQAKSA
jgi:hypothetical protein